MDRAGWADPQQQTVEEALYVIGKNVLGTNVTNRLLPVAAQVTRGLGLVGQGFNAIGGAIRGEKPQRPAGRQGGSGHPAPACTTARGGTGNPSVSLVRVVQISDKIL